MEGWPTTSWDGQDLQSLFDLEQISKDRFVNRISDPNISGALFGGQLLAQTLMAAMRTVDGEHRGRPPHAFLGVFIRAGNNHGPLEFQVERERDGSTLSHRHVVVRQNGKRVLGAEISFHDAVDEEGQPDHHFAPSAPPPDPEPLDTVVAWAERLGDRFPQAQRKRVLGPRRTVEVRPADIEQLLQRTQPEKPLQLWLRTRNRLPDDPVWHHAALAYLSDYWMHATLPPPGTEIVGDPRIASLNHGLWFHRAFRADDWLLYEMDIPSDHHARRFNRGMFFDRQGRLVASTAQEMLLRFG